MRSLMIVSLAAGAVLGCDSGGTVHHIDMAMKVNNGDMTLAPANCDIIAQNCGGGHKCVPTLDSSGAETDSCVADGTVAEGGACTPPTSSVLNDDCKAGFFCDFAAASPVCRKMCTTDATCTTGQRCGDILSIFLGLQTQANFGYCVPTCTAFSSAAGNCPTGQDCGESVGDYDQTGATSTSGPGFFFCKTTGTGAYLTDCPNGDKDCGPNLWCGFIDQNAASGVCLQNCETGHACSPLPADAGAGGLTSTCIAFSDSTSMAGFCGVM